MVGMELPSNGDVKLEDSRQDWFITYKRTYKRKRERSSSQSAWKGDASDSFVGEDDDDKVINTSPPKKKTKDIGWEHGVRSETDRHMWKCNWCGVVRSGGVPRLKQHLAGVTDGRKCPKVPADVAETMRKHLSPSSFTFYPRRRHKFDFDSKVGKCLEVGMHASNATRRFSGASKQSEFRKQPWSTGTQRSKIDMAKTMEKTLATMLNASSYGRDELDSIVCRWRTMLERILQLPDIREGDGIQSCIRNALISGTSFSRKFKTGGASKDNIDPKDKYDHHCEVQYQSQRPGSSADATSDVSKNGISGQEDKYDRNMKCRKVLLNILCSERFVLLCGLLCGTFEDRVKEILDFSLINSKMINGDYEQLPESFDQDIQQVWGKVQKFGQEIVLLASSLSNMSVASYQNEGTGPARADQRNSTDLITTTQFLSSESDRSTRPEQTMASSCKQCGTKADDKSSLTCDGCEAIYHFCCLEPSVEVIPSRSWYCAACITNRIQSPEPLTNMRVLSELVLSDQQDRSHQNCGVCDRLEVTETKENLDESRGKTSISRESSVSSMASDEQPEPSRTAISRLCKHCGTCEDDDKRFLICGHSHCPYKFYHIRCLKSSQIGSFQQQQNQPCWYCPSCLCRSCLCDKDDEKIVLCDGCDEGYHIYCMTPSRTSIPKGLWYCSSCNIVRAKEGMRRYEQWILQKHGKKDIQQVHEVNRSLDILLSAAEKLSSEERLAMGRKDK